MISIEQEIANRQMLIKSKADKQSKVIELRQEAARLSQEADAIEDEVKFIDESEIRFTILRTCLRRASKRELAYGDSRIGLTWNGRVADTIIWDKVVFGDAELANLPVSKFAPSDAGAAYYKDFAKEFDSYEQ